MKKILVSAIFMVFMVIMFVSCGGNGTSSLVGSWLLEDGQSFYGVEEFYTFLKDGTGIVDTEYAISWKIENRRFIIIYESSFYPNKELDYKVSGKILTITYADGKSYTYIKTNENTEKYREWRYSIETDPISDNKRISFKAVSSQGNNTLIIAKDGEELVMYINWGVKLGSSDTINVTFRIDDNEPETKGWYISSSRESSFFPNNPMTTIKSLLDAKQVIIRCTPQNETPRTAIFDITGFKEIVTKFNDELKWF